MDLAFDARGRLWVANYGDTDLDAASLVRFAPEQLAASGRPTPARSIRLGAAR